MKNACGAARHFFPFLFLLLNDVLRRHEERVDVLEAVELCLVDTVDDAPGGREKVQNQTYSISPWNIPQKPEKKTDWTKRS